MNALTVRQHLLLAILSLAAATSQAAIYRCETPSGETRFQQTPCEAADREESISRSEQDTAARDTGERQKPSGNQHRLLLDRARQSGKKGVKQDP